MNFFLLCFFFDFYFLTNVKGMNKWSNIKIKIPLYEDNIIQKLYTHCDYLRISFTQKHEYFSKILHLIDSDNTNQFYDDNYTYAKLHLSMGSCLQISLVYDNHSVPIMLYNEFDEKTQLLTKRLGRIDFYWSFFRLSDLNVYNHVDIISEIVSWFLPDVELYISRIDVACDVFLRKSCSLPSIEKICTSDSDRFQHRSFYGRWGKHISCEVGNSDSLGVFWRAYNKTIELLSKWKGFLYRDYLTFGSVHRYEVQFGSRYCKGLQLKDVESFCFKVGEYLIDNATNRGNLQSYYEYKEPARDRIRLDKYAKDILWRMVTYANNGCNPYILMNDRLPSKINPALHKEYLNAFLQKCLPLST